MTDPRDCGHYQLALYFSYTSKLCWFYELLLPRPDICVNINNTVIYLATKTVKHLTGTTLPASVVLHIIATHAGNNVLPVCSVIQCLTRLPEAIEVKLLRKSKNGTMGEEREEEGKRRTGMK